MSTAVDRRRTASAGDDGFTLVEVLVGLVILSIFMSIFTGAMVSTFRSVYRTQQTADAQQNLHVAFAKLDRQIRYSDGISATSANGTGSFTVMFSDSSSGTQICTQLRYTPNGTLARRSWSQTAAGAFSAWVDRGTAVATDVTADTLQTAAGDATEQTVAGAPFAVFPATSTQVNQRLEISFVARNSSRVSGSNTRSRELDVTFAALNTDQTTSSTAYCSLGLNYTGTGWTWPSDLLTS